MILDRGLVVLEGRRADLGLATVSSQWRRNSATVILVVSKAVPPAMRAPSTDVG